MHRNPNYVDPVDLLLELLERHRPQLVSPPEAGAPQLAAGGLVYAERLLRGIRVLVRVELADATGGLLRTLFECWCFGHYLLLKPDEATRKLFDDHAFHQALIVKRWNRTVDDEHPPTGVVNLDRARANLFVEQVANDVERLLNAQPDRFVDHAKGGYDLLYRFESTWSSHAGFGAFSRYLVDVPDRGYRQPDEWITPPSSLVRTETTIDKALAASMKSGDGGLAYAATWVASLAHAVYKEFELDVSELEAIYRGVIGAANAAASRL